MEGKIQVGGLMSFNVGTNLNTYGEELSTLKVSPDADYIKICLPSYDACFSVENTCKDNPDPNCKDDWNSQSVIVSKLCPDDYAQKMELGDENTGYSYGCTQEVTYIRD